MCSKSIVKPLSMIFKNFIDTGTCNNNMLYVLIKWHTEWWLRVIDLYLVLNYMPILLSLLSWITLPVRFVICVTMKMMMMNCFCGRVGWQKTCNLISSREHCQRSSPLRISDTPRAGFEPAQYLSLSFAKWLLVQLRLP